MKKEVYCSNCRHHLGLSDDCYAPKNIKHDHKGIGWPIVKPEFINEKRDCSWFEEKPLDLFVKKIEEGFMWFLHKFKRGFTLVELMIVISIILILAAIVIPRFMQLSNRSTVKKEQIRIEQKHTINDDKYEEKDLY